jgi:hypothetical protein
MKQFLLMACLIINASMTFAQPGNPQQGKTPEQREARREKMESMKIAHITQKLNLDPKTAEVFWPVYHQYENEMRGVMQEARGMKQDGQLNAEQQLMEEQKALDIKKKYTTQFNKILRPEQVTNLFQAEKEFRQMLMKRAREGQQEQGLGNRPQRNLPRR